jgi:hypothetical protein
MADPAHRPVVEPVELHPLCRTAVDSFTGVVICPSEMVPLQIDLAAMHAPVRLWSSAEPWCLTGGAAHTRDGDAGVRPGCNRMLRGGLRSLSTHESAGACATPNLGASTRAALEH